MIALLNKGYSEYPPAYLLARLRGRREHLVRNWEDILHSTDPFEPLLSTPYGDMVREHSEEGIWQRLLREFHWVYNQMNKDLVDVFQPYFLYCELKTIILCLRLKIENRPADYLTGLLDLSVLSRGVKDVLRKNEDLPAVLEGLNREFSAPSRKALKLQDIFLQKGLREVEEALINTSIEEIACHGLHPDVERFFEYIIDIRNILTLYKYMRWNVQSEPSFIAGGSIGTPLLIRTLNTGNFSEIERLIHQRSGRTVQEQDASDIEHALMTDLTMRTRTAGRSSDYGFILDYLWTAYIEARNLSIIAYGKDIERDELRKELVIR
jgi:vacuolar-type H+-ATPase subunit C/Vma6